MRMRPRRARRQFRRLARNLLDGMGAGPMFGPAVLQVLGRAHRLMASGEGEEAANLLGQLAEGAETAGLPKRAGNLRAQAALALVQAGQPGEAVAQARLAINLLESAGRHRRAVRVAERVADDLRRKGYTKEADSLSLLPHPLPPLPADSPAGSAGEGARARAALPAKCPNCGGAVRSDEVDWIDASSAECPFCGGVLRAE